MHSLVSWTRVNSIIENVGDGEAEDATPEPPGWLRAVRKVAYTKPIIGAVELRTARFASPT